MLKPYFFPGGREFALTLSYDDGPSADRRLISIMNKYGIRGTFHLCTGWLGGGGHVSVSDIPELYRGHEISVHTANHEFLPEFPNEAMVGEIMEDRRILENAVGYPVRGMSYPNGRYSDRLCGVLNSCGIVYSRTTKSTHDFTLPENFLKWHPTCHHSEDLLNTADHFMGLKDCGWSYDPKLFYVWGHSYEFDRDGNWDLIEEFCARMSGRTEVWYATNIEIYDYLKARGNLQFSADCRMVYNPSVISVWLNDCGNAIEVKAGETYIQKT